MAENLIEMPAIHLPPGEIYLARTPAVLKTILGSCVGVTFWSQRLSVGALCHGVLPKCPVGMQAPEAYRYVDFSISDLLRQFGSLGVRGSELEVRVFGGADVVPALRENRCKPTVGKLNSETAMEILQREGLNVMVSDLGGPVGRNIQFHTGTGEVVLRRLRQFHCGRPPNTEPLCQL